MAVSRGPGQAGPFGNYCRVLRLVEGAHNGMTTISRNLQSIPLYAYNACTTTVPSVVESTSYMAPDMSPQVSQECYYRTHARMHMPASKSFFKRAT